LVSAFFSLALLSPPLLLDSLPESLDDEDSPDDDSPELDDSSFDFAGVIILDFEELLLSFT